MRAAIHPPPCAPRVARSDARRVRCRYLRATLREPFHSQIWLRPLLQRQGVRCCYHLDVTDGTTLLSSAAADEGEGMGAFSAVARSWSTQGSSQVRRSWAVLVLWVLRTPSSLAVACSIELVMGGPDKCRRRVVRGIGRCLSAPSAARFAPVRLLCRRIAEPAHTAGGRPAF